MHKIGTAIRKRTKPTRESSREVPDILPSLPPSSTLLSPAHQPSSSPAINPNRLPPSSKLRSPAFQSSSSSGLTPNKFKKLLTQALPQWTSEEHRNFLVWLETTFLPKLKEHPGTSAPPEDDDDQNNAVVLSVLSSKDAVSSVVYEANDVVSGHVAGSRGNNDDQNNAVIPSVLSGKDVVSRDVVVSQGNKDRERKRAATLESTTPAKRSKTTRSTIPAKEPRAKAGQTLEEIISGCNEADPIIIDKENTYQLGHVIDKVVTELPSTKDTNLVTAGVHLLSQIFSHQGWEQCRLLYEQYYHYTAVNSWEQGLQDVSNEFAGLGLIAYSYLAKTRTLLNGVEGGNFPRVQEVRQCFYYLELLRTWAEIQNQSHDEFEKLRQTQSWKDFEMQVSPGKNASFKSLRTQYTGWLLQLPSKKTRKDASDK
ncbi:hypothetical protein QBC35DRAFT_479458, partial [Podospora australis]